MSSLAFTVSLERLSFKQEWFLFSIVKKKRPGFLKKKKKRAGFFTRFLRERDLFFQREDGVTFFFLFFLRTFLIALESYGKKCLFFETRSHAKKDTLPLYLLRPPLLINEFQDLLWKLQKNWPLEVVVMAMDSQKKSHISATAWGNIYGIISKENFHYTQVYEQTSVPTQ